ncbi:MAG: hypothetical protein PHG81_12040 [Aliarcobacter sp.]|nr:hypothetical protein [Aliarcobacter sp.]
MDNLPQRDDLIYKVIEEFQDYELTNCIAYEMMVRDSEYIKKIKNTINNIYVLNMKLNYFKNLNFDYNISLLENKDKELVEIIESKSNIEDEIKGKYLDIGINNEEIEELKFLENLPFLNDNQKYFLEDSIDSLIIELNGGRGYCNPIDIHEDDYTLEEYEQSMQEYHENDYLGKFEIIRQPIEDDIYDGFKLNSTTWLTPLKNAYIECFDDLNEINTPPFLVITGQYKHYKEIKPYFKRNIIPLKKERQVNLDINFALPKEELIAYISKIKDEYDKDNSIIKTPLELLGETLEKSDNKKNPKKPKASVYADWFYIYDYWKYEKTQEKTDKDIFVALEVENDVPYKEDMLRKIRDKMKYFIDELGYKELITGVKNS